MTNELKIFICVWIGILIIYAIIWFILDRNDYDKKMYEMKITGKEIHKKLSRFVSISELSNQAFFIIGNKSYIYSTMTAEKWDKEHLEYFFKKYATYCLLHNLDTKVIKQINNYYKEQIKYYEEIERKLYSFETSELEFSKEVVTVTNKYC